jgi:hypothetical protein
VLRLLTALDLSLHVSRHGNDLSDQPALAHEDDVDLDDLVNRQVDHGR